jgi:glycine hydroxymethyltransferase
VRADAETSDLDQVRDLAREYRPRLIVTGGARTPSDRLRGVRRDRAGGRRAAQVDMAHIAGSSRRASCGPVPHADAVTFTTYKTMLGRTAA